MTGFIVGLIIGIFVGIFVMCLMIIAKDDMPDIEDMETARTEVWHNLFSCESERDYIIWLSKSGYTPEAIARKLHLPLPVVKARLRERGITCD